MFLLLIGSFSFCAWMFRITISSWWTFLWWICSTLPYFFWLVMFEVYCVRYQNVYTILNLRFIAWNIFLRCRHTTKLFIAFNLRPMSGKWAHFYTVLMSMGQILDSSETFGRTKHKWQNINEMFPDDILLYSLTSALSSYHQRCFQ